MQINLFIIYLSILQQIFSQASNISSQDGENNSASSSLVSAFPGSNLNVNMLYLEMAQEELRKASQILKKDKKVFNETKIISFLEIANSTDDKIEPLNSQELQLKQQAIRTNKTKKWQQQLPDSGRIDQIIIEFNTKNQILKELITNVTRSNLTCQQKSSYLTNMLGRIQSAIALLTYRIQKTQFALNAAQRASSLILYNLSQTQVIETTKKVIVDSDKIEVNIAALQEQMEKFLNIHCNNSNIDVNLTSLKEEKANLEVTMRIANQHHLLYQSQLNDIDAQRKNITYNIVDIRMQVLRELRKISDFQDQSKADGGLIDSIAKLQAEIKEFEKEKARMIGEVEQTKALKQLHLNRINQLEARKKSLTSQIMLKQLSTYRKLTKSSLDQQKSSLQSLEKRNANTKSSLPQLLQKIRSRYLIPLNLTTNLPQSRSQLIKKIQKYLKICSNCPQNNISSNNNIPIRVINMLETEWRRNFVGGEKSLSNGLREFGGGVGVWVDRVCCEGGVLEVQKGVVQDVGWDFVKLKSGIRLNLKPCTIMFVGDMPVVGQIVFWRGWEVLKLKEYNLNKIFFI